MSAAKKEIIDEFDIVYGNIVKLYDHAENILNATYHESVTDHEAFLAEIEPIVKQIEDTANAVAADFAFVIESGAEPTNAMKRRVNTALRKMLFTIEEYKTSFKDEVTQEL